MSLRLKNPSNQFPPGGYPFTDERTGFKVDPMSGTPDMHAVKIIAHRRANPHIYPPAEPQWFDQTSVREEVLQQKFKTNPELFVGQPEKIKLIKAKSKVIDPGNSICECGALDWEPTFCPTCGGRKKVTGFKCRKCGRTRK